MKKGVSGWMSGEGQVQKYKIDQCIEVNHEGPQLSCTATSLFSALWQEISENLHTHCQIQEQFLPQCCQTSQHTNVTCRLHVYNVLYIICLYKLKNAIYCEMYMLCLIHAVLPIQYRCLKLSTLTFHLHFILSGHSFNSVC